MSRSKDHSASRLAPLLQHPALWRAGRLEASQETTASGFAALDEHLPGGGWPAAGLVELLLTTAGVGELRLLAPLLATLSHRQARWIAWVAPPFVPFAPALAAQGVVVDRLLLIRPAAHSQALWALERTARSGSCSLVLGWLDERRLRTADTRRLKLAGRQGSALVCLFRPAQAATQNSMAELRLQLTPAEPDSVMVDIRKRRGAWPVTGIQVPFQQQPGADALHEQLARWRQWQRQRAAAAQHSGFQRDHGPAPTRAGVLAASSGVVH
jgi:cell division inhibitor SulA